LLAEHPDWLRGQLQLCSPTNVSQSLIEKLPAVPTRQVVDTAPAAEQLSTRELAVLRLIAQGCSNQEISDQLFISLHTVKTHASHINSKLGVERRTQAVARAKELGVLG
jgi:LuxR family maltose regulon positive regulatory protein